MRRLWIFIIILFLFLPGTMGSNFRAIGNITLQKLQASVSSPVINEKVTFWVYLTSTQKYWDVKLGVYVDYELKMVKDIPYLNGPQKIWFIWAFNESGLHNITVVVDYKNSIPETNENDNIGYLNIRVRSELLPDLKISRISISRDVIFANQSFTVRVYVLSEYAPAYNIPLMIYLDNKNYTLKWLPAIPANQTYYLSFVLKLPTGEHSFEAMVNPWQKIKEQNYTNDYGGIRFRVYAKSAKCNVAVESISVSDTNPQYGQKITVYAKLSNTGQVPLINLGISVLYDGVPIYAGVVPVISVNKTFDFQYTLTAYSNGTTENHTITVFADYNNKYNETNETDNYMSANITVSNESGGILISPSDIFLSSGSIKAGMKVTIYVNVRNTGNSTAMVNVSMGIDNHTIRKFLNVEVAAHEYVTLYTLNEFKGGWHQIWVNVSYVRVFRTVWVEPTRTIVKFVNNSFKVSSNFVYVGHEVWLSVKILNIGDGYAENVSVMFIACTNNTTQIIKIRNISIAPDTYVYLAVHWNPKRHGNYTLYAMFLPSDSVNFKNLNESTNISVKEALPDLVVTRVSYARTNYSASIKMVISNTGVVPAKYFFVGIMVNGKLANKTFVFSLSPHSNLSIVMNVTLRDGNNIVTVMADYNNSVREYNESNNVYTIVINVVPNNNLIYVTLATIGVIGAVVAISGFFVYTVRRFIAALFYGIVLSLMGIWAALKVRAPLDRLIEGFNNWLRERE